MAVAKVQTGLRLEEIAWNKISYISKKNKRSLNAQIEILIDECIENYEKANGVIEPSDFPEN